MEAVILTKEAFDSLVIRLDAIHACHEGKNKQKFHLNHNIDKPILDEFRHLVRRK